MDGIPEPPPDARSPHYHNIFSRKCKVFVSALKTFFTGSAARAAGAAVSCARARGGFRARIAKTGAAMVYYCRYGEDEETGLEAHPRRAADHRGAGGVRHL
ncbi:MAG TPA: hypothetical protein IAD24_02455 [Candidatus Aphodomorpha intestinavium]|uniref:Uncharacterized protein n=1 Tax=Candidatus Aphodomorpha intestinavium TaxID=2840672 RepID=A0A9D1SSY2_9FIRM|nr:hypothetical protein [Candidatus Aphodomorpha intestinavium]